MTVRGDSDEAVLECVPSSPLPIVCQPHASGFPRDALNEFQLYQAAGPDRSRLGVEEDRRNRLRGGADVHDGDNVGHMSIRSLGSALRNQPSRGQS